MVERSLPSFEEKSERECAHGEPKDRFHLHTSLSYIDEKLQVVLGNLRDDFMGGFEPFFGDYGTFLCGREIMPQTRNGAVHNPISIHKSPMAMVQGLPIPSRNHYSAPKKATKPIMQNPQNSSSSHKNSNPLTCPYHQYSVKASIVPKTPVPCNNNRVAPNKLSSIWSGGSQSSVKLVKPCNNNRDSTDNLPQSSQKPLKRLRPLSPEGATKRPRRTPSGTALEPVNALHDSSDKPLPPPEPASVTQATRVSSDKKKLIIRVKFGGVVNEITINDDAGRGKKEEMHTSSGLDSLPSSSSPDKAGGPHESPSFILETMTSVPVLGQRMLSPLRNFGVRSRTDKFKGPTRKRPKVESIWEFLDKGCESLQRNRAPVPARLIEEQKGTTLSGAGGRKQKDLKEPIKTLQKEKRKLVSSLADQVKKKPREGSQGEKTGKENAPAPAPAPVKKMVPTGGVTRGETAADPAWCDNWVQCDKCQKWRLLPSSVNPDRLPTSWMCAMTTWLGDGMKSCRISEEITTAAVSALHI